ncbi:hypothetical protein FKM82_017895 [Ascaphus truei]
MSMTSQIPPLLPSSLHHRKAPAPFLPQAALKLQQMP